jgi:acylphosphatase
MKKQLHVFFSGTVQGVGFRFTVREIAAGLGVSGWVRNLADGRVEVAAEAEEEALRDFLARINGKFSHYIRDVELSWSGVTGEFRDFQIAF